MLNFNELYFRLPSNVFFLNLLFSSLSMMFMKKKHHTVIILNCEDVMRRFIKFLVWMILWVPFGFCQSEAQEFRTFLSFQGYSGLINIPNAMVTNLGTFDALYSNQIEQFRPASIENADNYMISVGMLPYFEIAGRLTEERPVGMRDISINAKIQIPRFFQNKHIPDIAVGVQDIGGGATNFETAYVVFTKDFWRFRISGGYGKGPDRLEGGFAGAEFMIYDWWYILGEYDTEKTNLGMRLVSPTDWFLSPLTLALTAKTTIDKNDGKNDFDVAFQFQFPLGFDHIHDKLIEDDQLKKKDFLVQPDDTSKTPQPLQKNSNSILPSKEVDSLDSEIKNLKNKLVDYGFENVRVGVKDETILYVEYENNRYNHNELDGLGLTLGTIATEAPMSLMSFIVILKEMNIPVLQLRSTLPALRNFMINPERSFRHISKYHLDKYGMSLEGLKDFPEDLVISQDILPLDQSIRFIGEEENSSRFKPRFYIYPGLITYFGTEIGVCDYNLSIKPELQVHLWKGGLLSAIWDIPIFYSDDFRDNTLSYNLGNARTTPQMESLMLYQSFRLAPGLMTMFSGGLYLKDVDGFENIGAFNETIWNPGNGKHRFKTLVGYFTDDRKGEEFTQGVYRPGRYYEENMDREIYLGSYRFYWDQFNVFFETTYGKYWHQDTGVTLELKRFFGDTCVSLYYQNVGSGDFSKAAGISISLPLTPRRDMKPKYGQIRGADQWSHSYGKPIVSEGKPNWLNPYLAVIPETSHNLERNYYNRDRLNEQYIRQHLLRLREAYDRFRDQ